MRILIEFAWVLAEKIGKRYLWVEVDDELKLEDLFLKILSSTLGKDVGETLHRLLIDREVFVVINGVLVVDPAARLRDGDKVFIQPVASGG